MQVKDKEDQRFAFGENWARFLTVLNDTRIKEAESSLKTLLGVSSLEGKSFLDIGSGSGLFSLAARRLGARVHSFDYDRQSVACTEELRRRYFPSDPDWIVESGSAIDADYMQKLGLHDVVYSWGVLHHTGMMWLGIELTLQRVKYDNPESRLYLAIYNDQGLKSHLWWLIKCFYNTLPTPINRIYGYAIGILANLANILRYTLKGKPMVAIRGLLDHQKPRGMSVMHDMIDWAGGFPFEFATFELLLSYMRARGFELLGQSRKNGSLGCHEMVFRPRV